MNIIITGGSKGMGKAMAEKFAADKNNIFICARDGEELKKTAAEIEKKFPGCSVKYHITDLEDRQSLDGFSKWIIDQQIDIDVLINNAGYFIPGSIYNEEEGVLEKMMAVNLFSAYHVSRALIPKMIERKAGHIFNICSIAALQAYANGGSYSISKFALMGFSKNLREELKPFGIKVTAVYPGAVYTSSWAGAGILPSRIMEVNDIADLVYAASHLSPQACVEDIVVRPVAGDLP
ncbi:MAG: SDR family NAD(P)-dependent oxidoreductase [Ginsengibacter sp.]|jgi:short-subunit dehydrogenase